MKKIKDAQTQIFIGEDVQLKNPEIRFKRAPDIKTTSISDVHREKLPPMMNSTDEGMSIRQSDVQFEKPSISLR